ncbi:MAG: restriction endonuclease [Thaumarchaeota archaeon]|nr:restriction endonuclease [Nitrososphaerota archaeon]
MNLHNLINGIKGIVPGGITLKEFSIVTRTSEDLSAEILDNLMKNGIGIFADGHVQFDENDRLKTGMLAITMGAPVEEISNLLTWQDFESLAAEILESHDFETFRNVILTKPRMQIDVVGLKNKLAILVDCKHWNRMTNSSLEVAVTRQIERAKRYLSEQPVRASVPVIVTLHQHATKFINKVPIVPINQLGSFSEELFGNADGIYG